MKRDFSIAVKAIIVKEDQVLVLRRSKEEMLGSTINKKAKWDLPGGGVHFAETCMDGLFREVEEETGLKISVVRPFSVYDVLKPHLHLAIFTYLCLWESGEVVLSKEHEGFVWMDQKQIRESKLPAWMKREFLSALAQVAKKR